MYKGTFVAIAEVVGSRLAARTAGDQQEAQDGWKDAEKSAGKPAEAAQSARPATNDSHSRRYPWPLKVAGDRRYAE